MKKLFKQFFVPGRYSQATWHRKKPPGSIHEGGRTGFMRLFARNSGRPFDNPDLLVACVVGDGEAETGPARYELALEQVF